MTEELGIAIAICATCGLLAGMIAYQRLGGGGVFVGFFIFGALLPLIGILVACFAKGPPQPAGWRPDPWRQSPLRWHDGQQWTPHVSDGS